MLTLRPATSSDSSLIVEYIRELAEFEKLSQECRADETLIGQWLFGPSPKAYCLLAAWDKNPAGFALYFYDFSTFLSRPGIYIEDIFIRPEFRRKGIAKEIFRTLAKKAVAEGCGRLQWSVLNWNKDAIALYESMGAISMEEWMVQRLSGDALITLAK